MINNWDMSSFSVYPANGLDPNRFDLNASTYPGSTNYNSYYHTADTYGSVVHPAQLDASIPALDSSDWGDPFSSRRIGPDEDILQSIEHESTDQDGQQEYPEPSAQPQHQPDSFDEKSNHKEAEALALFQKLAVSQIIREVVPKALSQVQAQVKAQIETQVKAQVEKQFQDLHARSEVRLYNITWYSLIMP